MLGKCKVYNIIGKMHKKTAIIMGAGVAGLAAAYELAEKSDIKPIVYEADSAVGGLAKTIDYKGNKMDIGGHRFFSKSDKIIKWWLNFLPLQESGNSILTTDKVMLMRPRKSRILFERNFFEYPLSQDVSMPFKLGLNRSCRIMASYIKSKIYPIQNECNLEDFFINRFGEDLYKIFFKDYTQKVWGVPCSEISNEWGEQRIENLSLSKIALSAFKNNSLSNNRAFLNNKVEKSLTKQFLYPKLGAGQLYEEVANSVKEKGGIINLNHKIIGIEHNDKRIISIKVKDLNSGQIRTECADYFISTIPLKELIEHFGKNTPEEISQAAAKITYRDFITVGLLLKNLKLKNKSQKLGFTDNWIYIQEKDIKAGRIQIYNNWSPYLVKDSSNIWLGVEYFCNQGDSFWQKAEKEIIEGAIEELEKIDFAEKKYLLDAVVVRMPKAYPAYLGSHKHLPSIKEFTDNFKNLFLVGRNGMHLYNNMDHSILTAMAAVDNIINGIATKSNLWTTGTMDIFSKNNQTAVN